MGKQLCSPSPARRRPGPLLRGETASIVSFEGMGGERAAVDGVVRILVAHSARLHRGAICAALECEPDLHVVAEADNATDAVEACDRRQPDVAILDGLLPGYEAVNPSCA